MRRSYQSLASSIGGDAERGPARADPAGRGSVRLWLLEPEARDGAERIDVRPVERAAGQAALRGSGHPGRRREGRPLLVFLHGYGGAPADMLGPAFVAALRATRRPRARGRAARTGDVGWWHDRAEGRWGSYVLRRGDPGGARAQRRRPDRVAIGGISMGGFGALDLGRHKYRFCAVGGHSPAHLRARPTTSRFGFDNAADFGAQRPDRDRPEALALRHSGLDRRRRPGPAAAGGRAPRPRATSPRRGCQLPRLAWQPRRRLLDAHFAEYLRFYADACN